MTKIEKLAKEIYEKDPYLIDLYDERSAISWEELLTHHTEGKIVQDHYKILANNRLYPIEIDLEAVKNGGIRN